MNKHPKFTDWTLYDGYYNKDVVTCPVWAKSFGHGNVYLQDNEVFDYTSSMGANSEYSYSGCFFQCNVANIEQAKAILDKKIPHELRNGKHKKTEDWVKETPSY